MTPPEAIALAREAGMEVANKYAAELREIAGMLAQLPDGPVRWKQYRLAAIADFLSTMVDAERAKGIEPLSSAWKAGA